MGKITNFSAVKAALGMQMSVSQSVCQSVSNTYLLNLKTSQVKAYFKILPKFHLIRFALIKYTSKLDIKISVSD